MEKTDIAAVIAGLGLTVTSEFIPFSKSRNKDEKHKSLNWCITIRTRTGATAILPFMYSAGAGHCPSHDKAVPSNWDLHSRQWQPQVTNAECESGYVQRWTSFAGFQDDRTKPILPDPVDVFFSLTMESSVLDAGGFESWCSEYGYDSDSRKAESIYRACLDQALQLRAAIGESGLGLLRDAFQDY